ncbi:MAG TPA: KUP/HAK/KT family potassium transporter [Opitutaceae bacterium]|nr:KUP/HAK/KT family potassium transporter [Opitutaceae bacterium]
MSKPADPGTSDTRTAITLGALGVVFGDIGTSPLYTLRECLQHLPAGDRAAGVLGVLSLVFWALTLVVSIKYLSFITRADNHGEGGIFALLALVRRDNSPSRKMTLGIFVILAGAALLYGEGMITPAISVLSAVEGFRTVAPGISDLIPLVACAILAGLFWMQHKGTRAIGNFFGPVILVWFVVIGLLGAWRVFENLEVVHALNPVHAWRLLARQPLHGIALLLGSVVLAITGVEALYADMGHFGRRAIARAWYWVVLPGLVLNYFGQGAHALAHPEDLGNPFFALAPAGLARLGLVLLSIAATIIASQALISGTFSLTRQAIQLGFFPRLAVLHTSAEIEGQIFLPLVNRMLAVGAIAIVLGFGSSERLAGAYGLAVTGAMAMTTIAFYFVARRRWHWSPWLAGALCAVFLVVDVSLFMANIPKIPHGGWLPLATGLGILALMFVWKRGREIIVERVYDRGLESIDVSTVLADDTIHRVGGTAVFMASTPRGTPLALLHHLKSNRCVQKTVVLLSIAAEPEPHVPDLERLTITELGHGAWRAIGRYGYMESPDVTALVERLRAAGVRIDPMSTTYYFNREMVITGGDTPLWEWQKSLYAFLSRNARPAKDYFRIPPNQIIEIGLPLQL